MLYLPPFPPEPPAVFSFAQQETAETDSLFVTSAVSGQVLANQPSGSFFPIYLAQAMVPAADGVGTQVTPQGDRFDITGGQLSGNGANLFHSFSQFGLSQGQIANFLANPQIRNILTRITGGEASLINGRIQVTGGHSNLFLINPAGIVFGPSASLNVAGSFLATTANRVGFGCQRAGGGCAGWLDATGANDYGVLGGNPNGFAFTALQGGAIANLGRLTVGTGQTLTLLGGTVLNAGTLSAPEGQITVASVPGTSLVRLSQAGSLLSLEIEPIANPQPGNSHPPASLAELLTGGNQPGATEVQVNHRGEIVLTHSGVQVDARPGTTIVGGVVDVSGRQGGGVTVVGDRVGLVGATMQASGSEGGGTVRIGGDFQGSGPIPNASRTYISPDATIHADALNTGNGGRVIVWADQSTEFYGTITARGAIPFLSSPLSALPSHGGFSEVSGKQTLIFRGNVDLSAPAGHPGTLLLDPVDINIIAGAGGAQDGALPTVLAGDVPATFTISQTALQSQVGTVILQATNNITIAPGVSLNFVPGGPISFIADADNSGVGSFIMDPTQTIQASSRDLTISGANLTLGTLDTSSIAAGTSTGGNITLSALNDITVGDIATSASATPPGVPVATAGNVAINGGGSITAQSITTFAIAPAATGSSATGGNVNLAANNGNISFSAINTTASTALTSIGGNVNVLANGVIQGTAVGTTINTASPTQSGSVTIQHDGGPTNLPFVVGSLSTNGTAGTINAGGASVITANSFPVLPTGGSVVVGTAPNTITITSVNQPPTLTVTPTLTGATEGQPFAFTYADLSPAIADANQDQTSLIVSAINSGTLLVNGVEAIPGTTTLVPGDGLVYIPPATATGLLTAFTLIASDGVSSSAAAPVTINIQPFPEPEQPGTPGNGTPGNGIPEDFGNVAVLEQPGRSPLPSNALALTSLPCRSGDIGVDSLDDRYGREFEEFLSRRVGAFRTRVLEVCDVFNQVTAATGVKPAIVYVSFVPASLQSPPPAQTKSLPELPAIAQRQSSSEAQPQDSDRLELIAVVPDKPPIYRRVSGATRARVLQTARQLANAVTDPTIRETTAYLAPAQQLYQWLIQPLVADLQEKQIDNLTFILDVGLRSLPLAALHDGKGFLIERFSIGLMPSLSLTDTRYRDLKNTQVLAMGASKFETQRALPAVPVELATIFKNQWQGSSFLNERFTLDNLRAQRRQQPYGIIHLATHAEFRPGSIDQSYIQLWDTRLGLDQVPKLGWNDPPVELLVLSACRTALGNVEAELGFAGLAYQTGVRSALASLWAVDDEGTLGFMSEFYRQLKTAPIRADAVRQTQLALIRKQVRLERGQLITPAGTISLPPELQEANKDLSFPFYWAAFTLVGNPW